MVDGNVEQSGEQARLELLSVCPFLWMLLPAVLQGTPVTWADLRRLLGEVGVMQVVRPLGLRSRDCKFCVQSFVWAMTLGKGRWLCHIAPAVGSSSLGTGDLEDLYCQYWCGHFLGTPFKKNTLSE